MLIRDAEFPRPSLPEGSSLVHPHVVQQRTMEGSLGQLLVHALPILNHLVARA